MSKYCDDTKFIQMNINTREDRIMHILSILYVRGCLDPLLKGIKGNDWDFSKIILDIVETRDGVCIPAVYKLNRLNAIYYYLNDKDELTYKSILKRKDKKYIRKKYKRKKINNADTRF